MRKDTSLSGVALLGPHDDGMSPEEARFGARKPLPTLLLQSIGPWMYFVGNATHDALDLFLIAKALGQECLQIVGFSSLVRYLIRSFAVLFSQGAVARISGLIGEQRTSEAEQVVADLYRLTIVTMIVVPVIFVFATKPMLVFMGCTDPIADRAFSYLIPILCAAPFTGVYQMGCGFLQSEGRSIANGLLQLSAFILNCGVFAPILLFWVKVDLDLAGLAFALSQLIPGIVLMFLIFGGKFNLKPKWSQWKNKFTVETRRAVVLASPFLLSVLAGALPPMLLMNFMMKAAAEIGASGPVASAFSVFLKIQTFANSFSFGINQGFLAAGSYAYAKEERQRVFVLLAWDVFLGLLILGAYMPLMIIKPEWVCSIWITSADEMAYAKKMVAIPFYVNILNALNDATVSFLLIARFAYTAMTPSLLRGVTYIIGAVALYYTNKTDPVRMMWSFGINDLTIFVLDVCILIVPFKKLYTEDKLSDDSA